jgi:ribosomal protein L11 methyltransferase
VTVHELALVVDAADVEAVLDELLLLAPHGVIEVPAGEGAVELRLRGAPADLPERSRVQELAGSRLRGLAEREVPDDWRERRVLDYAPAVIGGRLVVRPDWAPAPGQGLIDVALIQSDAFGTGTHVTTRACLEIMLGLEPGGAFLDLGCGSGVLAIAAAKLGWSPVVGLDRDPVAVEAARANAASNGVSIEVGAAELLAQPPPAAPTIFANAPVAVHLTVARKLIPPVETLVVAGIKLNVVDRVVAAYGRQGLVERERFELGTWVILRFGAAAV